MSVLLEPMGLGRCQLCQDDVGITGCMLGLSQQYALTKVVRGDQGCSNESMARRGGEAVTVLILHLLVASPVWDYPVQVKNEMSSAELSQAGWKL